MKLLFASNNQHKCNEMKDLFQIHNYKNSEIIFPYTISTEKHNVVEDGENYQQNALIKAKSFYNRFNLPCFSDDSGLEVFSINSKPGINSARYSGENATDKSNRVQLLSELKNNSAREARFVCVICFYDGNESYFFEGFIEGKIIDDEIGSNGFGYDPIFIPNGYSITFAEMNDELKNKISHRAVAVEKFIHFLKDKYAN